MTLQPFVGPCSLFLQFRNLIHSMNPWPEISPSLGRYLHTDIHALSGNRTHDPSVRADEDGSCLRPRGHVDRLSESGRIEVGRVPLQVGPTHNAGFRFALARLHSIGPNRAVRLTLSPHKTRLNIFAVVGAPF
jgi:hypothetical protein